MNLTELARQARNGAIVAKPPSYQQLIQGAFTASEWRLLGEKKEFLAAVQRAESDREVASLVRLGKSLLDGAGDGRSPPTKK